jgi:acetyl-CoA carboxylase biotin carboxylase subunit
VPFVERECSIQRRHQKVIEETPSPVVTPVLRGYLGDAAAAVARTVGYTGAGTIEFLLDEDNRCWFLEMNTRLQVEHAITEMVTGIDLVEWQIRIARAERLDIDPVLANTPDGHAIECRIYAEDPDRGFIPSPGRIAFLRAAAGPWVRDEGGADSGGEVPVYYDPLISKLCTWGPDRPRAIARMARALREYEVLGIQTTVPFFRWILAQPAFLAAAFHTGYLDELLQQRGGESFGTADKDEEDAAAIAAALHFTAGRNGGVADPTTSGAQKGSFPGVIAKKSTGWKARARLEALQGAHAEA